MNGSSKCCWNEKKPGSRTHGEMGCGEPGSTLRLTEPGSVLVLLQSLKLAPISFPEPLEHSLPKMSF